MDSKLGGVVSDEFGSRSIADYVHYDVRLYTVDGAVSRSQHGSMLLLKRRLGGPG
jgi:hypothetical protein